MSKSYIIRKTHRYLGLFIGIQFLGWTIGGMYFSWNKLDDVHGDHMRKTPVYFSTNALLVSPSSVIDSVQKQLATNSISSIQLINIAGRPFYQVGHAPSSALHSHDSQHSATKYTLVSAITGKVRGPINQQEAISVAENHIVDNAELGTVTYLETADPHHEFRDKPVPAWAVSFKKPACTVYVSAELGTFQAIRHDQWRAFDFLWMIHTMDYQSRDNFNNWLLRSFSILGIVTVASGFALFFVSFRSSSSK